MFVNSAVQAFFIQARRTARARGASGGTRNPNHLIRSQKLYPIELGMPEAWETYRRRGGRQTFDWAEVERRSPSQWQWPVLHADDVVAKKTESAKISCPRCRCAARNRPAGA